MDLKFISKMVRFAYPEFTHNPPLTRFVVLVELVRTYVYDLPVLLFDPSAHPKRLTIRAIADETGRLGSVREACVYWENAGVVFCNRNVYPDADTILSSPDEMAKIRPRNEYWLNPAWYKRTLAQWCEALSADEDELITFISEAGLKLQGVQSLRKEVTEAILNLSRG